MCFAIRLVQNPVKNNALKLPGRKHDSIRRAKVIRGFWGDRLALQALSFFQSGSKICIHQSVVDLDRRSANIKRGKLTGCEGKRMIPKQVTQRVCQASIRANKKRAETPPLVLTRKRLCGSLFFFFFQLIFRGIS